MDSERLNLVVIRVSCQKQMCVLPQTEENVGFNEEDVLKEDRLGRGRKTWQSAVSPERKYRFRFFCLNVKMQLSRSADQGSDQSPDN